MTDACHRSVPPTDRHLHREPWPLVRGRPGAAQGRYGEVGNLELVACDVDDGLWVGWFNADEQESYEGAAVGHWSGGLRFGRGRRYTSAGVTQVRPGPQWLEAVALAESGAIHRFVWSPADGFVDHGVLALDGRAVTSLCELPDGSHRVVLAVAGELLELVSHPADRYPAQTFVAEPVAAPGVVADVDAAVHGDHLDLVVLTSDGAVLTRCAEHGDRSIEVSGDASGVALAVHGQTRCVAAVVDGRAQLLVWAGSDAEAVRGSLDGPAEAVSALVAHRPGRTEWHLMTQAGGRLRHHVGDVRLGVEAVAATGVEAAVWSAERTGTVHRG